MKASAPSQTGSERDKAVSYGNTISFLRFYAPTGVCLIGLLVLILYHCCSFLCCCLFTVSLVF